MVGNRAGQAARTYEKHDIETSDPVGLVVRIFELASRNLSQARAALRDGNMQRKGAYIDKVSRCLGELQASLDREKGAEVARNLDRLYNYWQRRLTEGHLRNDDQILGEIAEHLSGVTAAWREIVPRQDSRGVRSPVEVAP